MKFLDFQTDKPDSNDSVLIASPTKGVRKTTLANLRFSYLEFSGETDDNGYIDTGLSFYGNHAISISLPQHLTSFFQNIDSKTYQVRVEAWDRTPISNAHVAGTIYYVSD